MLNLANDGLFPCAFCDLGLLAHFYLNVSVRLFPRPRRRYLPPGNVALLLPGVWGTTDLLHLKLKFSAISFLGYVKSENLGQELSKKKKKASSQKMSMKAFSFL